MNPRLFLLYSVRVKRYVDLTFFYQMRLCLFVYTYSLGVSAFILVALERVPLFENAVLLEFGRGFRSKPLRVNLMDLDYELLEELVCLVSKLCA